MKYAIVRIKGTQYKVEEKSEILVDKLGDTKLEPEVLLVRDEGKVKVGNPLVKGAKVELEKLADEKGEKIHVFKYKAKSRYRKKIGSRPSYSRPQVVSIK